jgi:hypothetical protein
MRGCIIRYFPNRTPPPAPFRRSRCALLAWAGATARSSLEPCNDSLDRLIDCANKQHTYIHTSITWSA